jgi:hypothetical protein
MARQPIDEKCVPIHLGFWQYGFNATYTHPFIRVVEFNNPADEVILTGPVRNSRGNAWSLLEQHSESGIHITPKTTQSLWLGEKMDDEMAIQVMLQLE